MSHLPGRRRPPPEDCRQRNPEKQKKDNITTKDDFAVRTTPPKMFDELPEWKCNC